VGPKAGLNAVERRNLLSPPGTELAIPRPSSPYPIVVGAAAAAAATNTIATAITVVFCCLNRSEWCHNTERVFIVSDILVVIATTYY
jgi:hypothetical protein